jgi:hypothetical protein
VAGGSEPPSTRSFLPMPTQGSNGPVLLAELLRRFRAKFHAGNLGMGFACTHGKNNQTGKAVLPPPEEEQDAKTRHPSGSRRRRVVKEPSATQALAAAPQAGGHAHGCPTEREGGLR